MGYLDYRKQVVRDLGIHPRDCSFNPGVFVADMDEWKKQKITKQLEKWMEENFRYAQWPAVSGKPPVALCARLKVYFSRVNRLRITLNTSKIAFWGHVLYKNNGVIDNNMKTKQQTICKFQFLIAESYFKIGACVICPLVP